MLPASVDYIDVQHLGRRIVRIEADALDHFCALQLILGLGLGGLLGLGAMLWTTFVHFS